jgi:hypothetical protein
MKKNRCLKLILAALASTACLHADTSTLLSPAKQNAGKPKEAHLYEYHNRVILFQPLHQGYERIKPDAFYVGVEGYVAPEVNQTRLSWLLDAELRLGYNFFFRGRDHLTPVTGIGYAQTFSREHSHTHHKPGILYSIFGLLYDHAFNSVFNLGVNAKFLLGGAVNSNSFDWGSPVIGCDASLPITLRFGRHRHWDYRIEPFNFYLHGSHATVDYFGFRNTLAYRF